MKRVLILAYDFPPYVSVGGLRPYSWYKYLNEFGVYPIVITRQWGNKYGNHLDYIAPSDKNVFTKEETENGTIIRTPYKPNWANKLMLKYGNKKYKLLRKLITAYFEIAQFVFCVGPKSELYRHARKYLQNNEVDLIIATGEPFVLFKYASNLSQEYGVPWIADYRDAWIQKRHVQQNVLLKVWYSCWEKKFISTVAKTTTVSDFLKTEISNGLEEAKFEVIPNGFDSHFAMRAKEIKQNTDKLSFVLIGSIYDWHPIRSFLRVMTEFLKEKGTNKISLSFYGINMYTKGVTPNINYLISSEFPELKPSCIFNDKIENERLFIELAKQNVMVLFNDYSIMGTKIFDYIGVQRSILFCYEADQMALDLRKRYFNMQEREGANDKLQLDLIRETNAGYIVRDEDDLKGKLEMLYEEFSINGYIDCITNDVEKYSRRSQVNAMANVIASVINKKAENFK